MKTATLLRTVATPLRSLRRSGRTPRWAISSEPLTIDDLIADLDPGWLAWRERLERDEPPRALVA